MALPAPALRIARHSISSSPLGERPSKTLGYKLTGHAQRRRPDWGVFPGILFVQTNMALSGAVRLPVTVFALSL